MKKFILPLLLLLSFHNTTRPEPLTVATTFTLSNLLSTFSLSSVFNLASFAGAAYLLQPANAEEAIMHCTGKVTVTPEGDNSVVKCEKQEEQCRWFFADPYSVNPRVDAPVVKKCWPKK